MPSWYKTGTVDTTAASAAIVGTGTFATINFAAGDIFLCSDEMHEILSVTDDTHWTLATNFGTTENDVPYAVIRNFTGTTNATLAYKLTELLNSWQLREDEFENWSGGTATGGVNIDGKYPLTDAIGNTQQVYCPAKIAALVVEATVITWSEVTEKPTFGTASAKNVGTASTDVAAGDVVTVHNADSTKSHLSAAQKVVATQAASAATNGYLTLNDWTTFNAKEPAITGGTTSQYLRGDKSLSNFASDAIAAAPAETATTAGALFNGATAKSTPVDADMFGLMDSAGGNVLKKLSWANLVTAIGTALSIAGKALAGAIGSSGLTMSTGVLLGRGTAATGAVEEIVLGANLSLTGNTLNAVSDNAAAAVTYETLATNGDVGTSAGQVAIGNHTHSDYITASSTTTLTNKRTTLRVGSTTSSATPTINTDNYDIYKLTAQAVNITSFTTNLSGTPTDGQCLIIHITGTAARTIAWGTSFEASTVALPTTTVSTAMLTVGFIYNAVTSKWRCVAAC